MKTKLLATLIIASLFFKTSFSQIHISITTPTSDPKISNVSDLNQAKQDNDQEIPKDFKELKFFMIKCKDLPATHVLKITSSGETMEYKNTTDELKLEFKSDLLNNEITIQHFDDKGVEIKTDEIKFRLIPEKGDAKPPQTTNDEIQPSIDDFLTQNYSNLEATPFGFIDPSDKKQKIHIFFDQFGNSLMSTIPQGISNAQYTVHIIYPFTLSQTNNISYSIKQKTGSFSSALLFNNSNIRSKNIGETQSGEKYAGITERKFLLGTSTDDLTFDIVVASKENEKINKTVLETYTIKMSPVYHGSFDIGLFRTDLSNPTFTLTQLPNSTDQVVKKTDESPKGIVTVMATFYVSPIILAESIFGKGKKKIPFYKLTGRNFLDDHKLFERFYPTIGVSVSDKSFENIFYGINWEIARGLSIFGGFHYGKVNTFTMPNFQPGVTHVTNEEFQLYQNNKWKTSTAFGVTVDISIIKNLFGTALTQ